MAKIVRDSTATKGAFTACQVAIVCMYMHVGMTLHRQPCMVSETKCRSLFNSLKDDTCLKSSDLRYRTALTEVAVGLLCSWLESSVGPVAEACRRLS